MRPFIKGLTTILLTLFLGAGLARAADNDGMKYILQIGYDHGGETVAWVQYINGPAARVRANEGLILDFGVSVPNMNMGGSLLETQAMAGLKYVTTTGANGKISFTSFPLTVIEQFTWRYGIMIGAGATYQLNPDLSGTGVASTLQVRMKNALGYIGQVGYTSKQATFGVRYTKIEYQPKLYTGKIKGDGFGFFGALKF